MLTKVETWCLDQNNKDLKTNQVGIILQNSKRFEYPDFYKIVITDRVAK